MLSIGVRHREESKRTIPSVSFLPKGRTPMLSGLMSRCGMPTCFKCRTVWMGSSPIAPSNTAAAVIPEPTRSFSLSSAVQ